MFYKCLACGCIHSWQTHPLSTPIIRHVRYPAETVWYCPQCGKEHRTTDGTMFGQLHKWWETVKIEDVEDKIMLERLYKTKPNRYL